MEYLYNELVEINPDNLFRIVQTLIGLDAEYHWLTEKEIFVVKRK
jgi:hypothetical protein